MPGEYRASVAMGIQLSAVQYQYLRLADIGTVTATNADVKADFAIPQTPELSGRIRISGLPPSTLPTSVTATQAWPAQGGGSVNADPVGQYRMILQENNSYSLGAVYLLPGISVSHAESGVINMSGPTTYDFTFPSIPSQVAISGRVTDSLGRPVSGVTVGVSSQSLAGSPTLSLSGSATTDFDGKYHLAVLAGTNYRLTFTPPLPSQ